MASTTQETTRLARCAAALALALAACGAQAAALVSTTAGAQLLHVAVNGDLIAVDLTLREHGSASFEVALDAADVGQWLRFNAVIGSALPQGIGSLQIGLAGAGFAWVGSVTPAFGALASIEGDEWLQVLRFAPAELFGLDLGAPFGQAGTQDWLLGTAGLQAGERFTVTISAGNAVPEPASGALVLGALGALGAAGWRKRRRARTTVA